MCNAMAFEIMKLTYLLTYLLIILLLLLLMMMMMLITCIENVSGNGAVRRWRAVETAL